MGGVTDDEHREVAEGHVRGSGRAMVGLLPCPFCGELPVSDGETAMHACYVLGKEIRTSVSAWNCRSDKCDRAALLALADDMRRHVAMDERSRCRRWVSPDEMEDYARRIRDACGEER